MKISDMTAGEKNKALLDAICGRIPDVAYAQALCHDGAVLCGLDWGHTAGLLTPGLHPLLLAVIGSQTAPNFYRPVVAAMLVHGAPADVYNSMGETALFSIAQRNTAEMAQMLIDHGAEVNRRTNDLTTPLMIAAASGNLPVLRCLLDNGAEVNARNLGGRSALSYTFEQGTVEMAEILIGKGAALNVTISTGETLTDIAALRGNPAPFLALLEQAAAARRDALLNASLPAGLKLPKPPALKWRR